MSGKKQHERGLGNRAKVHNAIIEAGSKGIGIGDIVKKTGLSRQIATTHCNILEAGGYIESRHRVWLVKESLPSNLTTEFRQSVMKDIDGIKAVLYEDPECAFQRMRATVRSLPMSPLKENLRLLERKFIDCIELHKEDGEYKNACREATLGMLGNLCDYLSFEEARQKYFHDNNL